MAASVRVSASGVRADGDRADREVRSPFKDRGDALDLDIERCSLAGSELGEWLDRMSMRWNVMMPDPSTTPSTSSTGCSACPLASARSAAPR